MTGVSSSFNVNFTDSVGAHLSAEVDGRTIGLNKGKTSFEPGDHVGFLVYYRKEWVRIDVPFATDGSIEPIGKMIVEKTEEIKFIDTRTTSLQQPAQSLTSQIWLGNSLGNIQLLDDMMSVQISSPGVGVAKVKYLCEADGYWLKSPAKSSGFTDFTIVVFIKGHLI